MSTRAIFSVLMAWIAVMPAFTEETGPQQAVEAFHAALSSGERAAVLALLSPQVVIFEGGGAEMSRDEYASHHLDGDMQFEQNTHHEIVERSSSSEGDLAWVITRSKTSGTFREKSIDLVGTETMVLRRTGDGWRIVHIHWSSRKKR